MRTNKHYDIVDYIQYSIGGVIVLGGVVFLFRVPDNPSWIHLAIPALFLVVGGAFLKIPGFRGFLSRIVDVIEPGKNE
jgi:uncharacterized protein (DUF983 family)